MFSLSLSLSLIENLLLLYGENYFIKIEKGVYYFLNKKRKERDLLVVATKLKKKEEAVHTHTHQTQRFIKNNIFISTI